MSIPTEAWGIIGVVTGGILTWIPSWLSQKRVRRLHVADKTREGYASWAAAAEVCVSAHLSYYAHTNECGGPILEASDKHLVPEVAVKEFINKANEAEGSRRLLEAARFSLLLLECDSENSDKVNAITDEAMICEYRKMLKAEFLQRARKIRKDLRSFMQGYAASNKLT